VTVKFLGYGDTEQVPPEKVRLESAQAAANRKKRKEPDQATVTEIPKHLQILPTDSEKVRQAKKKRIKALKLQTKLQAAEQERSSSKLAWKNFNDKIGKKKKTGFLTGSAFLVVFRVFLLALMVVLSSAGTRKESIFKSPEGNSGKVGVTGSGHAMTAQQRVLYQPKKAPSLLPEQL
jgi:survival-of-motor-neuron-related-splicing factor 30